jgi:hypothetical protein
VSEPAENIPERLTRVAHEVGEARKDAAAANILAGGTDRNVVDLRAELRAHTNSLQALRETQIEQGNSLAEMRTEMREGYNALDTKMRDGFSVLKAGQVQITMLLHDALRKGAETDRPGKGEGR